jgi:transposase
VVLSTGSSTVEACPRGGRVGLLGRAYWRRKNNGPGKSRHAMRCLKRRISDAVYRQLVTDATARQEAQIEQGQQVVAAGRVGHPGASLSSSAADLP